ncbi:MAG: hypothetical protein AAFP98_01550, partial [Pseudomonadota bacterium]
DRPAGYIRPGKSAPKKGKATIKKRDTVTPTFLAGKCVTNAEAVEKGEMQFLMLFSADSTLTADGRYPDVELLSAADCDAFSRSSWLWRSDNEVQ